MPGKKTRFNFEKTLAELEELVGKMEQGEFSLEESLKQFERGIALTRACQNALTEAEQKVRVLLEGNGSAELAPFTHDAERAD